MCQITTPRQNSAGPQARKTKVKAAANNAAGQVLGTSNNLAKDPTVQVGQSCSGGAGCEGGKFTGNFFGGG